METGMSNPAFNSFLDIFAAPNAVFDRIREKSISPWMPFLLMVILSTAVYGWYFMTVDMYQFMETSMSISGQEISTADFEAMMQTESIIRGVSIGSAAIGMVVVYLLLALFYFLAATLIAEEKLSFGQFFSVVAWASLPGLLGLLSVALTYALSSDFAYITQLDKTSLSSLLGMSLDSANFDLAAGVSVGAVWSYVLYGMGFARVTRCGVVTAIIVGLIPPAIQFGLTYLF
jgi:hypothetical protein